MFFGICRDERVLPSFADVCCAFGCICLLGWASHLGGSPMDARQSHEVWCRTLMRREARCGMLDKPSKQQDVLRAQQTFGCPKDAMQCQNCLGQLNVISPPPQPPRHLRAIVSPTVSRPTTRSCGNSVSQQRTRALDDNMQTKGQARHLMQSPPSHFWNVYFVLRAQQILFHGWKSTSLRNAQRLHKGECSATLMILECVVFVRTCKTLV